jgi:hypothetical protein
MTDTPMTNPEAAGVSAAEQRRRSSLVRQAVRFVVLNLKILKLTRQHH